MTFLKSVIREEDIKSFTEWFGDEIVDGCSCDYYAASGILMRRPPPEDAGDEGRLQNYDAELEEKWLEMRMKIMPLMDRTYAIAQSKKEWEKIYGDAELERQS